MVFSHQTRSSMLGELDTWSTKVFVSCINRIEQVKTCVTECTTLIVLRPTGDSFTSRLSAPSVCVVVVFVGTLRHGFGNE